MVQGVGAARGQSLGWLGADALAQGAGAVAGAEPRRQLNSSKHDLCSTIALIFLLR